MPLEERIEQYLTDLKPRNDVERRLVCLAARLSWEDVLDGRFSQEFWKACSNEIRASDPARATLKAWPELGPRPRNKTAALKLVRSVFNDGSRSLLTCPTPHALRRT